MRFLVLVCFLCSLFVISSLPASGASQQVCLPTVQGQPEPPPEQPRTVLINEVLLSSKKTWSCPGSTSVPGIQDTSWVELYNPMTLPFNLYGVHAAIDGGPDTSPMLLTFGSAIAAHGFLTIFPDKNIIFPKGAPETFIRRLLFNGTTIDQITIPSSIGEGQPYEGYSYARTPDGASKWVITNTPTIGSSNILPKPTPKPTRTPKPTPAPKSTIIKKKSSGSKLPATSKSKATPGKTTATLAGTTVTGASDNPPLANGSQPSWNQLQLPGTDSSALTTPSAATISSADTTATSPPTNTTNGDVLRTILIITGLGALAACALLWWRRWRIKHS